MTSLLKPPTWIGELRPVARWVPGTQLALKPVIALPPLLLGAVKLSVAEPLPALALVLVGAAGTPAGVTLLEVADALLSPIALLAITLQLTATPLPSAVTRMGGFRPLALWPPQFAR